ncbi:MAG: peptidase [Burkholderiales bacterium 28-67-8]|nr:MAG: peptidase [Burkholderiales bacterium 28-67-8]
MRTMNEVRRRRAGFLCAVISGLFLAGCSSTHHRAPVEDRRAPAKSTSVSAADSRREVQSAAPGGPDNAGRPGYYTVRPQDTLVRIALDNGQNWKDLARWNGLENPNLIEVGQVLRVAPPGADPSLPGTRAVTAAKAETRPLDSKPATTAGGPAAASSGASAATTPSVAAASAPTAPAAGDDAVNWMWPASGPVTTNFDETKSKGLAIAGKAGDPVMAAADGRVVYAGSGLRGYGNLVIVKHNSTYLTAYAHNQALLVKEDQAVRRGQKIAEMGSTDSESVQLHFEIRRQGKPIDPAKLLPPR